MYEFLLDEMRKFYESYTLLLRERPRNTVNYAQRSYRVSITVDWLASIEANVWLASHQVVLREAWVARGVFDNEHLVSRNSMAAERKGAMSLLCIEATSGLEPLSILIDQRD